MFSQGHFSHCFFIDIHFSINLIDGDKVLLCIQAIIELKALLLRPPQGWDYRCALEFTLSIQYKTRPEDLVRSLGIPCMLKSSEAKP